MTGEIYILHIFECIAGNHSKETPLPFDKDDIDDNKKWIFPLEEPYGLLDMDMSLIKSTKLEKVKLQMSTRKMIKQIL